MTSGCFRNPKNPNLYRSAKRVLDISPWDIFRAIKRRLAKLGLTPSIGPLQLTADQLAELGIMRQDNCHAGSPFTASKHWQEVVTFFEDVFRREGITNPEEQPINLRFSGFAVGDPRLHRYICWMYRRLLEPRDSLKLLHKLHATCCMERGFGYEMDGDLLSLDLLLSIDDFYNLYELSPAIASEPVVVAELGAGWGRLGYVLRMVNPKAVYLIFDLPEVLLISQTYLPKLFPGVAYVPYSKSRSMRHTRQSLSAASLWFCGPHQMTQFELGSVDFILNIGSFQEMPIDYVAQYLRLFSSLAQGGWCYLRQLRDGRAHNHQFDEIPGLDHYPFPSAWEKKYLRSTMLSDEFFETGFAIPKLDAEISVHAIKEQRVQLVQPNVHKGAAP